MPTSPPFLFWSTRKSKCTPSTICLARRNFHLIGEGEGLTNELLGITPLLRGSEIQARVRPRQAAEVMACPKSEFRPLTEEEACSWMEQTTFPFLCHPLLQNGKYNLTFGAWWDLKMTPY